jgi:hypothetical protein
MVEDVFDIIENRGDDDDKIVDYFFFLNEKIYKHTIAHIIRIVNQ